VPFEPLNSFSSEKLEHTDVILFRSSKELASVRKLQGIAFQ